MSITLGVVKKQQKIFAEAGKGGATIYNHVTDTGINLKYISTKAVTIYSITCIGTTDNLIYLKLYNKATGMDPEIDKPLLTIPIPGNTKGAGVTISYPVGADFSEGLCCLVVKGVADGDKNGVDTGSAIFNITYK